MIYLIYSTPSYDFTHDSRLIISAFDDTHNNYCGCMFVTQMLIQAKLMFSKKMYDLLPI